MAMSRVHPKRQSHSNSRYFYTDSLYLAAYLFARGLWLSNAEIDSAGRYRFAFRDVPERKAYVQQFQRGPEAPVDARTFMYAIEELKLRASQLQADVKYDE